MALVASSIHGPGYSEPRRGIYIYLKSSECFVYPSFNGAESNSPEPSDGGRDHVDLVKPNIKTLYNLISAAEQTCIIPGVTNQDTRAGVVVWAAEDPDTILGYNIKYYLNRHLDVAVEPQDGVGHRATAAANKSHGIGVGDCHTTGILPLYSGTRFDPVLQRLRRAILRSHIDVDTTQKLQDNDLFESPFLSLFEQFDVVAGTGLTASNGHGNYAASINFDKAFEDISHHPDWHIIAQALCGRDTGHTTSQGQGNYLPSASLDEAFGDFAHHPKWPIADTPALSVHMGCGTCAVH